MIQQPPLKPKEMVNEVFYKKQSERIATLNEIFWNVSLSREETGTLLWLTGWEDSTVQNLVSAIKKAIEREKGR